MEAVDSASPTKEINVEATLKNVSKLRAKKRKRESSGSMDDVILPENSLEVEKNLKAVAMKNNLDDASVKKILKKVVTNEHVLALVKLCEKEDNEKTEEKEINEKPITRAKAKELMKASAKSAPWNLELTPINHIPVKTRPEVKALIAQELPDDEDDEEYQPAHDEVQSDDDHTTCNDSHPATPSTPKSATKSTTFVTDGLLKVPQDSTSQVCRQLDLDEEATIALRTRSKLSLSATPIEHIESSFIPPDDIPLPDVDDLWTDFLKDCLNPVSNTRNEEDDEADPEYNVAADPDVEVDEDEESLENSLIKISKKELNDLVTELLNVMPEAQLTPVHTNEDIQKNGKEPPVQWEGKQEPNSDEEDHSSTLLKNGNNETVRFSIGKTEPPDAPEQTMPDFIVYSSEPVAVDVMEELVDEEVTLEPPPAVRNAVEAPQDTLKIYIENVVITNEQIMILQQQLRMHIQIAASNFLQLYINPAHWSMAPKYKEYLETLCSIAEKQKNSVARVCNLQPALELINSWEKCVSEDTPENKKIVNFIQAQMEKCRRRSLGNSVYVGDFPEEIKEVIANSPVFLYPYLLPPMPYRAVEIKRRTCYLPSEDQLIIMGLDQFWSYVEANPEIYRMPPINNTRHRWGLGYTLDLICKHMLSWFSPKTIAGHISTVRKRHRDHEIVKYFKTRVVPPTKHVLIPFNPELTLYEQPEMEMPKLWVRFLAKSSKRFRVHLQKKRPATHQAPEGVEISSSLNQDPIKPPLPIQFTEKFSCNRINVHPIQIIPDKMDVNISVNTDMSQKPEDVVDDDPKVITDTEHCSCCRLLRKITKHRQKRITEYVKKFKVKMECPCRSIKHPKITNRLRMLLSHYRSNVFGDLKRRIDGAAVSTVQRLGIAKEAEERFNEAKDRDYVTSFHIRLSLRQNKVRNQYIKRRLFTTLSRFNPEDGDPVNLMNDLFKACDVDLADMFNEFLAFLNPEQADRMDKFRDYFINNCMEDLVQKTEEIVTDRNIKLKIFKYLETLSRKNPESCVICSMLMQEMHDYPQLARFCFTLFPHQRKVNIVTSDDINKLDNDNSKQKPKISEPVSSQLQCENDVVLLPSNKNNEQDMISKDNIIVKINEEKLIPLKDDENKDNYDDNVTETVITQELKDPKDITTEKTPEHEHQEMDLSDNSDLDEATKEGLLTICEEPNAPDKCLTSTGQSNDEENILSEKVKTECEKSSFIVIKEESEGEMDQEDSVGHPTEEIKIEWKRDEDKLILELLRNQLSVEETLDKSINEIIEDKQIPQIINKILPDKTLHNVRDRINYLLQIMILLN